ncbi:MAG: hypothetical protein ACM3SS_00510, partial [Rhodospirillaceae bacterium]
GGEHGDIRRLDATTVVDAVPRRRSPILTPTREERLATRRHVAWMPWQRALFAAYGEASSRGLASPQIDRT